jgi:hypothetical protein
MNLIMENVYWEAKVNICNSRNSGLHEVLAVVPVMILIILFVFGKFFYFLLLYPARSRWGTYLGYCSRRDGDRTSVKTGSWKGRTHSQLSPRQVFRNLLSISSEINVDTNELYWVKFSGFWIPNINTDRLASYKAVVNVRDPSADCCSSTK